MLKTFFDYNYVAVSEFAPVKLNEGERTNRLVAKYGAKDGPIMDEHGCYDLNEPFEKISYAKN